MKPGSCQLKQQSQAAGRFSTSTIPPQRTYCSPFVRGFIQFISSLLPHLTSTVLYFYYYFYFILLCYILFLLWPMNASGSAQRSWKMLRGRGTSGTLCLACCHHEPGPDKQRRKDGWIFYFIYAIFYSYIFNFCTMLYSIS